MNTYIPEGYKSLLGVYDTQKAIGLLKRLFEDQLAAKLNLFRVSAPLFLEEASGLNDNLNGYERPVSFDIKGIDTGKRGSLSGFPDAEKASSYAQEALQWTVAEGIIGGSDGKLLPQGNATRAQVATILMRFIENIA